MIISHDSGLLNDTTRDWVNEHSPSRLWQDYFGESFWNYGPGSGARDSPLMYSDWSGDLYGYLSDEEKSQVRIEQELMDQQKSRNHKARDRRAAAKMQKFGKDTAMGYMAVSFANEGYKPRACMMAIVTPEELEPLLLTIRSVQSKFNLPFQYPWVLISQETLSEEFKTMITNELALTGTEVHFSEIPTEQWSYPSWIDQDNVAKNKLQLLGVPNGDSQEFRHRSRYLSGLVWKNPVLRDFDWAFRVEPGMEIFCELDFDIFRWMQDEGYAIGFSLSTKEPEKTVKSLLPTVKTIRHKHPYIVVPDNFAEFVEEEVHEKKEGEDKEGQVPEKKTKYNQCTMSTSFMISNINFFRSPQFKEFFEEIDANGGIYNERWSDSSVITMASTNLLPRDRITFLNALGYKWGTYENCPIDDKIWFSKKCQCDQGKDITFSTDSCVQRYYDLKHIDKPDGWDLMR